MANYISGDYKYKYEPGSGTAAVEVTDKTKSSYEVIQSPITIEGQLYTVTDMSYCFESCAEMVESPAIPSTVTNLDHCYVGCNKLTTVGTIPAGVTNMVSCFETCSSLVDAPELPNGVTEIHDCFWGCTSLVEAPDISSIAATDISYLFCNCTSLNCDIELPSSAINVEACFFGCKSLTEAPAIGGAIDNVMYCFYGCTSLKGGLYVANNPTYYTNILGETIEDICIIDRSVSSESIWSDLVGGNIFYKRDAAGKLTVYGDYIYNSADSSIHVYNKNKTAYDSFDVIERIFTSLENCFKDCVNLQSIINIPDGITNLKNCFSGCTSVGGTMQVPNNITAANVSGIFDDTVEDIYLWYYGDSTVWHTVADLYPNVYIGLPTDGFDEGDYHYTFEDNYTLSCYAIDKTKTTYSAFITTFTISGHTYTTTDLSNCFDGCVSMTSSPVIPSTITDIDECYKNCELLTGNITVSTYSLDSANNVFVGTAKPIFIIRNDSSGDATSWRAIVSEYSNVHFEADDVNAPKVEAIILEIGVDTGDSWYYDSEGHSLRIKVNITVGTNNLPVGYTNDLENGAPVIKIEDVVYASTDWSKTNNVYTGFVVITDAIKEKTRTVTVEATDLYGNSYSNTAQLESIFVMLDFKDGGKGMAVGRVATRNGLTIQIPTAIGNGLKPPTTISGEVDLNNFQLVIGNYNEEVVDADFVVGSGTGDNNRRNSFVVKSGGIYSYDESKTSVMAINTAHNQTTCEEYNRDDINGDFTTTISNIKLPSSGLINFKVEYKIINLYTLTGDTTPVSDKPYYVKNGNVYTRVEQVESTDNPAQNGWYEMTVVPSTTNELIHSYSSFGEASFDLTAGATPTLIGTLSITISETSIVMTTEFIQGCVIVYDLLVEYPMVNESYVSYAFGKYLNVAQELQFVMGTYNKNSALNVLEIGNGTSNNERSNAFAVNKNGRVIIGNKGAIAYEGTKATLDVIRFIDNKDDTYGHGVVIGSDGTTILGAGEYPTARMVDMGPNTEQLYLGADSNVYIETGADTFANRKTFTFTTVGDLTINRSLSTHNRTQRAGVSWIAGARGDAALIYQPRTTANDWTPVLVQRTKGGGSWQIGNYDTENLLFQYCTKANIDSQTNTVTKSIAFTPSGISGDSIARSSTSTITSIITVDSANATIVSATYNQWGKVAQLYIDWTNKKSINVPANGNITNFNVGTLVAGKRPTMNTGAWSNGDQAGAAWYNIGTGGVVNIGACEGTGTARTIAAGTHFYVYATFILP